jgi:hypothetical protein
MSFFINSLEQLCISCPKTIVETGTYLGDGIKDYLASNYFDKIYSIEISNKYYLLNKNKFITNSNVEVLEGDSADVITHLINNNILDDKPVLFYLDAHFSGADTGGMNICNGCPVLKELEAISKRNVKGDVIFIDDMRLMGEAMISGCEGCKKYPLTFFDFRHATLDNMLASLNRKISLKYMCPNIDRLLLVLD